MKISVLIGLLNRFCRIHVIYVMVGSLCSRDVGIWGYRVKSIGLVGLEGSRSVVIKGVMHIWEVN